MNKKLLAVAIGAATTLPVVAEAAGPTLYGKINLSLESVTDARDKRRDSDLADLPGSVTNTDSDEGWVVRSNDSRLGVKGDAETGITGLTGIYQMEFSVDASGEGTTFGSRDIFAGLKGTFGQIRIGNMDTPLKKAQGKIDQFNDTAADIKYHIAGEKRMANSLYYSSPKIVDGLTVNLAIAPGEGIDDPESANAADVLDGPADYLSASLTWESEALYLALAMDQAIANGSSFGAELASGDIIDITRAVAGYKLDDLELGLMYQLAEESFDNGGNVDEDTSILLSAAYRLGDLKLKAQYSTTEGDDGDDTAGDKDREVSQLALGADYALGKATTVYAFYSMLEDDEGSNTNAIGATGDDDNYDVLAIGIDQKF
ncbi:MAG: porin [Pseudomonadota bacterium]